MSFFCLNDKGNKDEQKHNTKKKNERKKKKVKLHNIAEMKMAPIY